MCLQFYKSGFTFVHHCVKFKFMYKYTFISKGVSSSELYLLCKGMENGWYLLTFGEAFMSFCLYRICWQWLEKNCWYLLPVAMIFNLWRLLTWLQFDKSDFTFVHRYLKPKHFLYKYTFRSKGVPSSNKLFLLCKREGELLISSSFRQSIYVFICLYRTRFDNELGMNDTRFEGRERKLLISSPYAFGMFWLVPNLFMTFRGDQYLLCIDRETCWCLRSFW